MNLRFEVDQAEAFRRGVNVPKSIVTVDIDPAGLSPEKRNLIADRLRGIDVFQMCNSLGGSSTYPSLGGPQRIVAKLPTFDMLMAAIEEDEAKARERRACTMGTDPATFGELATEKKIFDAENHRSIGKAYIDGAKYVVNWDPKKGVAAGSIIHSDQLTELGISRETMVYCME